MEGVIRSISRRIQIRMYLPLDSWNFINRKAKIILVSRPISKGKIKTLT
jgi:hypothetical protein